jgi:hypothetical protein
VILMCLIESFLSLFLFLAPFAIISHHSRTKTLKKKLRIEMYNAKTTWIKF